MVRTPRAKSAAPAAADPKAKPARQPGKTNLPRPTKATRPAPTSASAPSARPSALPRPGAKPTRPARGAKPAPAASAGAVAAAAKPKVKATAKARAAAVAKSAAAAPAAPAAPAQDVEMADAAPAQAAGANASPAPAPVSSDAASGQTPSKGRKRRNRKTPVKQKPADEDEKASATPEGDNAPKPVASSEKKTPAKQAPTNENEKSPATPEDGSAATPVSSKKKNKKKKTPTKQTPENHNDEGPATPAVESAAKSAPSSEKKKKKKTPKKLPPGRFDLPETTPKSPADDSNEGIVDSDSGTPQVKFNGRMTEAKLALLNSSPLSRLIPEGEREAAAGEVNTPGSAKSRRKRSRETRQPSKDEFVPLLDDDDEDAQDQKRKRPNDDDTVDSEEKKKMDEKVQKAMQKATQKDEERSAAAAKALRGVMYLGHIPHGFYEKQMLGYFSQFGEVSRIRLSRSPKTGRSRGYAFIEFAEKDVAEIAAEAMDGYLMHKRILEAKLVPPEDVHDSTFKGCNRVFRPVPWSGIQRTAMLTRAKNPVKLAERSKRISKSMTKKKKVLLQMGVDYEFPEVRYSNPAQMNTVGSNVQKEAEAAKA